MLGRIGAVALIAAVGFGIQPADGEDVDEGLGHSVRYGWRRLTAGSRS